MTGADLKFDKMICSTSLARDYLEKHREFRSIGFDDSERYECNQFKNKIYYCKEGNPLENTAENKGSQNRFLALVEKVQENKNLICELDYLLRKIPIVETENIDLKLITQKLLFEDTFPNREQIHSYNIDIRIFMAEKTPLWVLGSIAQSSGFTVYCTMATVAICTLFVELCHDVGFGNAGLAILPSDNFPKNYNHSFYSDDLPGLDPGCVGIVTEKSDIDSAVDTFLTATTRYPWKLKKIFVQESVFERFKVAITGKKDPHRDPQTLFCEVPTGNDDNTLNTVTMEAYRTVKEVMSLLGPSELFAVSLWSSDVAESNEIAFGIDAAIVWINGYGLFEGSPYSSNALYSVLDVSVRRYVENLEAGYFLGKKFSVDEQKAARKRWLQLDRSSRIIKIRNALQNRQGNKEKRIAIGSECDSVFCVGNYLCVVQEIPAYIPHYSLIDNNTCIDAEVLKYIVDGGAAYIVNSDRIGARDIEKKYQLLEGTGALVKYLTSSELSPLNSFSYLLRSFPSPVYKMKVIWTSIGTTFAN